MLAWQENQAAVKRAAAQAHKDHGVDEALAEASIRTFLKQWAPMLAIDPPEEPSDEPV
jgi:hypothetical protein